MQELPERLIALADTLDGCQWEHPLNSAESCRRAANEILRLNQILALERRSSLATNLCPDHRGKQAGKPCLACTIEHLSRHYCELAAAVWGLSLEEWGEAAEDRQDTIAEVNRMNRKLAAMTRRD